MTTGRLTKVAASIGAPATTSRLAKVTGTVSAPTGTTGRLAKLTGSVPPSLTVACPDQINLIPFSIVSLTATSTGTPDTWTFTSPGLTFSGSGATRTFIAPAVRAGVVVPITITAAQGATVGSVVVHCTVYPHGEFKRVAGVLTPVAISHD